MATVSLLPVLVYAQGQGAHRFSRTDKFVPGQLIVRYKDSTVAPRIGASATTAATPGLAGAKVARSFKKIRNLRVVELPEGTSVQQAIHQLRADPNVLYAEPDYIVHTDEVVPNDPLFTQMWGMKNTGQSGGTVDADINATDAWTLSTGSNNVIVGNIDTGVDYNHPDLAANIFNNPTDCNNNGIDDDGNGYVDDCHGINPAYGNSDPYDDNGHGTHTSGTIGAVGNNGIGVVGVNWHVTIMPCKFLNYQGSGSTSGAIACLDYFATMKDLGYNIVATNNSWGGGGYSQGLYDAIKENMDRGILFVAAAGNGGSDGVGDNNDLVWNYPSNYDLPNIIAVEATTRTDARAGFSNFGRRTVDLGAPGAEILSTLPGASYGVYSGTSMATPHVTGAIALLKAWNSSLSAYEIRNLLLASGDNKAGTAQTLSGKRLNVNNAMHCVNSSLTQRTLPVQNTVTAGAGVGLLLEALNINCADGSGGVSVVISPGGGSVTLLDDGSNGDRVAGDGIYSAVWGTNTPGTYTLTFPGSDVVTVTVLQQYAYLPEPYNYRNITGTNLNLGDDTSATITSPFPLDFGGKSFSQLKVGSNGVVSFLSGYNSSFNEPIPTTSTGDLIAPFWVDLMPQGSGNAKNVFWATLGSAPNRELVVEWRNLPLWAPNVDLNSTVRFQAVFFENSSDIVFNYADVLFNDGTSWADNGGFATVGIQIGPSSGRQFSFMEKVLQNGMSLRWKTGEPDYVLDISDPVQNVAVGATATFHGKVNAAPGYAGSINLNCANGATQTPPTCNISPTVVGANDSFTVQTQSPTENLFRFLVTGSDGTFERVAKTELRAGNYVLLPLEQSQITVPRDGQLYNIPVSITRLSNSQSTILVHCGTGLPAGVTCWNTFISPAPGETLTYPIYLSASPSTTTGTYNIEVQAYDYGNAEVQSQPLDVTVALNPSFKVAIQPLSPPNFLAGTSTNFGVQTTPVDGFTGNLALSCLQQNTLQFPMTCTFDPASVSESGASTGTIHIPSNTPLGWYSMYVNATDGNRNATDGVSFSIADFPAVVTPSTLTTVVNGNPASYSLLFNEVYMNQQVAVSCGGLVAGMSCTPAPSSIWPGQSSTVSVGTTAGTTPLQTTTIQLTGSALGGTRFKTVQLKTTDFSLTSATAGDLAVNVTGSSSRTISAKALNGFMGAVALSCSIAGSPSGMACVVPASVTPTSTGAALTASVSAATGVAPGAYTVMVTGTNSGQSRTYSFTAQAKDYHLSSAPTSRSVGMVPAGQTDHTTYALSAFADNGFSSSVALSCATPLPTGVTCAFTPASLTPTAGGAASTLTATVSSTTPPGTFTLNVKAVSGSIIRQLPLTLITGGPNFTQAVSPTMVNAVRGNGGSFTVTYTLLGGMSDPIAVGCSTPAAGITCSAVPDTVVPGTTPNNQSVVTFIPSGAAAPVNTAVTITGSALGIVRSNSATLSVKDFSLTSTTAGDLSVNAGATAVRGVQVKSLNGLTGTVVLSCAIDGAPAGVTCTVPASTTPSSTGTTVNASIATTSAAPAGGYLVTISGTSGGQTRQYQFNVQVRDYTVTAVDPVSIGSVPVGQTDFTFDTLSFHALNGFNSNITLSCVAPLPTGVTCTFTAPTVVPSSPVTFSSLTLKASSSTPNGSYTITVRSTAGALVKNTSFTLNVGGPNFIPTVTPASAASLVGTAANYTLTLLLAGGMTTPIDVSCETLTAGLSCSANPAQVTPGVTPANQSVITVTGTPGVTPLAAANVLIRTGSADLNRHRSTPVTYTPRDFSLSTTTPARVVNAASSIVNGVTVRAVNGFSGPVTLDCAVEGAPVGMTCSLPASVSPSSTGTGLGISIGTSALTPAGTYTVHVNGSNSGQTRSMSFTVDVRDFSLDISPSAQTIAGTGTGSTTFSLTLTSLNGFASSVFLSCAMPIPTGLTCAFSPSSVVPSGAGSSSTLTVNVTASNTRGDHPLTVRAASGLLVRQQTVTVTHGP